MPRLKDSQAERRRCLRACESCRRRKEKCNGLHPCAGCVKRNIDCIFVSNTTALGSSASSSGDMPRRNSSVPTVAHPQGPATIRTVAKKRKVVHLNESVDSSDAELAIDNCLNPVSQVAPATSHLSAGSTHTTPHGDSPPEAPVPRVARLLRDGRGKFMYIGDSASLAFLQNVRRVASRHHWRVRAHPGPTSPFYSRTDAINKIFHQPMLRRGDGGRPHPDLAQAEMLANQYLTATTCLLDLFDTGQLFQALQDWTTDNSKTKNEIGVSILYLVLAIGAQVTAEQGWGEMAERYFNRGRHLAFLSYTDEPSLQTVQSFVLISHFLLGDCRRNAAFLNLGMAVRAAYALGLHRGKEIQTLFLNRSDRHGTEYGKASESLTCFLAHLWAALLPHQISRKTLLKKSLPVAKKTAYRTTRSSHLQLSA